MALQCNINARGKLIRMVYGIGLIVAGVLLLFAWAIPAHALFPWTVTMLLIVAGAFAIFESRAGWCVIRALGWKTPI